MELCSEYNGTMFSIQWNYVLNTMELCSQYNGTMFSIQWNYVLNTMELCSEYNGTMFSIQWNYVLNTMELCSQYNGEHSKVFIDRLGCDQWMCLAMKPIEHTVICTRTLLWQPLQVQI